ncbi:MAG: NAD-dependent dihydropyrimidine dehydrogenase subunit PreA [Lachnospiraceae bacterium]|nr:NAD-dependent dihydropyrimidine dehydrogenase subunit PreA [Lachnospiraceae bacterium]
MAYETYRLTTEAGGCLLCKEPSCTASCPKGKDPGRIIRAIRFENLPGAIRRDADNISCIDCDAPCIKNCRKGKLGKPVDIPGVMKDLEAVGRRSSGNDAPDLSIDFCGFKCENPFLLSSSVVGSNYEMVARAFDAGWAGVAFKTIGTFVPDEVSPRFAALSKESNPFVGFKNIEQISDHTLEENLEFIRRLNKDYPKKMIIASIMGQNEEEWTKLAALMEDAGADVIECNFSCPQMVGEGLGSDVGTDPDLVAAYTAATRKGTGLPILAKMTPNITDMTIPAIAAVKAGADGIAAINTIKSVMNVDLDMFVTAPSVNGSSSVGGYSGKAVKPIALRFISDMKKNEALKNVPISGMGGIETWRDAAEFMAMGCGTIQVTTAVMQYGYRIIEDMIEGMSGYMSEHGIESLSEIVGKGLNAIKNPDALDRSTIEYPKFIRKNCIGCGRCYVSCADGGHQAIAFDGKPVLIPDKCVGCQLCRLVCPADAISAGVRVKKK